MSKRLKQFLFGIWGLLLIPLITPIFAKWLEENVSSDPNGVATTIFRNAVAATVFDNLLALGQRHWFQFALVFLTGIVVGVSLEWLNRKSDEEKASQLRSLGSKFRSLSDSIKARAFSSESLPRTGCGVGTGSREENASKQETIASVPIQLERKGSRTASSGWPDNVRDLQPAILSALSSARKFDLWAPDEQVYQLPDASFLCEYFRCVGKLLEDGHFNKASSEALSWRPFLDKATLS
jgi:hypothetical protein